MKLLIQTCSLCSAISRNKRLRIIQEKCWLISEILTIKLLIPSIRKNQWSSWSFIRQLWSHRIHRKNAHPPEKRVTSVNSSLYLPNDHGRRVVCVSRTSPYSLIAFPLRYTRGGLRNIFDAGELRWIVLAKAIVAPVLPAAVSHRDFRRFRLTQPRYYTKAIWQIRLLRRK